MDLRSDTLTVPGPEMRQAMAQAEVGDDVYGEDPTVRRLQERAADRLGKEAALFVPSGTMANQLALLCHCRRGDDVIIGHGSHTQLYESGGGQAIAGVGFSLVGTGGLFDAADVAGAIHADDPHFSPSSLVVLENTHNRSGGRVFPLAQVEGIAAVARERSLAVHIDGARIWNAAVASGLDVAALAAPADSVSACFSKGLGAPAGSVLAGSRDFVASALRYRKMLGGGMRQVGILAAGALHGLEHNLQRLAEDHRRAKSFARGVAALPGIACNEGAVETNIVNFDLEGLTAEELVARAELQGLKIGAFAPQSLRAVTHLGVSDSDVAASIEALGAVLDGS